MARRWGWRSAGISVAVSVWRMRFALEVIPFRWAVPAARSMGVLDRLCFHAVAGPIHAWTMTASTPFGVEIEVCQNPFHGTPIVKKKDAKP